MKSSEDDKDNQAFLRHIAENLEPYTKAGQLRALNPHLEYCMMLRDIVVIYGMLMQSLEPKQCSVTYFLPENTTLREYLQSHLDRYHPFSPLSEILQNAKTKFPHQTVMKVPAASPGTTAPSLGAKPSYNDPH